MHAALGATHEVPFDWPANSFYDTNSLFSALPVGAQGTFFAYPDSAFPLAVFFDHEETDIPFQPGDSAAFWSAANFMEAAVGRDLFRPSEKRLHPQVTIPLGTSTQTVRPFTIAVVADTSLGAIGADGAAGRPINCLSSPVTWATCETAMDYTNAELYVNGVPSLGRSFVADRRIVQHELGHILGLGHSCSWNTMMATIVRPEWTRVAENCRTFFQDGPWTGASVFADSITPRDAAHVAVYLAVAAKARQLDVRHTLFAAALGERLLMLGLPPEPFYWFRPYNPGQPRARPTRREV